jgi:hypothetical protein
VAPVVQPCSKPVRHRKHWLEKTDAAHSASAEISPDRHLDM